MLVWVYEFPNNVFALPVKYRFDDGFVQTAADQTYDSTLCSAPAIPNYGFALLIRSCAHIIIYIQGGENSLLLYLFPVSGVHLTK